MKSKAKKEAKAAANPDEKRETQSTTILEEYRERQRDEIEALKSIFMQEFEELQPAWRVGIFYVVIRCSSDLTATCL
jgi:hypothetical protein